MHDFSKLIDQISARPAMYVGNLSIAAMEHFLAGYLLYKRNSGQEDPLNGWEQWIENKFPGVSPGRRWSQTLLDAFGTEDIVFRELPSLFKQFSEERPQLKPAED